MESTGSIEPRDTVKSWVSKGVKLRKSQQGEKRWRHSHPLKNRESHRSDRNVHKVVPKRRTWSGGKASSRWNPIRRT